MTEQWFREQITAAVDVSPPAPNLDAVLARGRAARYRRFAITYSGAGVAAAVTAAGVAISLAASGAAGSSGRLAPAATGSATVALQPSPAPTAQPDPSSRPGSAPASEAPGPVTSQQVTAFPWESLPPADAPRSSTCTPGVATDKADAHARVATMCLPTQLPRWSERRNADTANRGGASYFLSDEQMTRYLLSDGTGEAGGGGGSVTMQMFAGSHVVLANTGDFSPRADGTVGHDVDTLHFVRTATVLGQTATEVRTQSGQLGLLLHVDGIAIEAYATGTNDAPATFEQLEGVVGALRWDRSQQ